jgi:glutamyl-tRNA(Gln) amidotransferase subunit E
MEFKTKKEIIYLLNHLNVCTYEMDDTPPFLVNQDALDVAIEVCLAMGMDIIDEVHIARKQYLDGSIPTGFQRTAIVGMNGSLPFKGRDLTITHVSIEEDSCREVKDRGHRIVWRTDRLGMPLTETVTGPELVTPEEVRDAILLCGLVARNTGRVRTGIGASRQDVNVSVRGGQRVEIKGVSKAGYAVKLVHNEAIRQSNLLKFRDELHRRGIKSADDIRITPYDVTDIFAQADLGFMRRAIQAGGKIFAARMEGGIGLAQFPTQPETMFLDELSGRIRVIACLDEPPIVLSGSLMPEFPDKHKYIEKLRKRIRLCDNDDYFLVFGPETDCRTAVEEIRLRFVDATKGVPQETRQSLVGGYTTFERILPGPDRMYPDTDSPPTRITPERVEEIRVRLQTPPWERIAKYEGLRVPRETTEYLIRRGGARIVDALVEKTGVDPLTAAIEIGQRAKASRRAGIPLDRLGAGEWIQVFDLFTDGKLPREFIQPVAAQMAENPGVDAASACANLGIQLQDRAEWTKEIGGFDPAPVDEKNRQHIIGQAVRKLKGKAPAKEVAEFIQNQLPREAR